MRSCVTCLYWILLVIWLASSALLFLTVASEDVQAKHQAILSDKNESFEVYDNAKLEDKQTEDLESPGVMVTQAHHPPSIKANYKDHYHQQEHATVAASFETVINEEKEKDGNSFTDPNMLVQSLTQQPNLSQRMPTTENGVVLTLVDRAAADLQSLAEPNINPDLAKVRSFAKNSSSTTSHESIKSLEEVTQDASPSMQFSPSSIINESAERPNDTKLSDEELLPMQNTIIEEATDVVVVVRAEQNPITSDSSDLRLEEEGLEILPDEVPKVDDAFAAGLELNDTAARAQLAAGARDEAAAVILGDGIVGAGPTDPHEDIPSFSEWAQKRLEEAEKKKTHPNASAQNPGGPGRGIGGMKVRSKNYASPDCGAKIIATNPEARSARSVLASTRDEYMLNTCTSRIWFIVELCEAIQAKKIELANFELFSSSPKDFSVYVSDRFPTREWTPVGQFTAKDTKDIQSFALSPHLFGKFIKIELHTYYGSEHFCPISLFRAYGTSEFEVLETETDNQVSSEATLDVDDAENSDEEESLDAESGEPPRNLFGSARDAVLSIVKKAAEVLVKSSDLTGNNITQIQESIDSGNILESSYNSCTTPRYTILCGNCSDEKFAKVFQLVSCRERQLDQLLRIGLVNETLRGRGVCRLHGVEIFAERDEDIDEEEARDYRKGRTRFDPAHNMRLMFLTAVFKPEYIIALCNVLATKERKVVMNTSYEIPSNSSEEATKEDLSSTQSGDYNSDLTTSFQQVSATCTFSSSSASCKSASSRESRRRGQQELNFAQDTTEETVASVETSETSETLASQIKPTKTLSKVDMKKESSILVLEPSKESTVETIQAEVLTTVPPSSNVVSHPALKTSEEPSTFSASIEPLPQTTTSVPASTVDHQEPSSEAIGLDTTTEVPDAHSRIEKSESLDQDGRQGKVEPKEQEIKLSSQDPLTFDTLLSDLKDFENEAGNLQNGSPMGASIIQPATSTMPQKESVFLRLSNRIKTLERNMSLSGQYLEELSRRYKKQVEEMQRSLERAVSAMGEESRKGEERDSKRMKEITVLREEIAILSQSVESLLYDRDSWRGRLATIGQHTLMICFEVLLMILITTFCRRTGKFESDKEKCRQAAASKKEATRRKSTENFGAQSKKAKKRRPSEIASNITGTYRELLIEDRCQEGKKDRKKKRKKEIILASHKATTESLPITRYKSVPNIVATDIAMPSRKISSIDPPRISDLLVQVIKKPGSVPDATIGPFSNHTQDRELTSLEVKDFDVEFENDSRLGISLIDDLTESNSTSINLESIDRLSANERNVVESWRDIAGGRHAGGILKAARLSSPSSFMKTALASRKKRKLSSKTENQESSLNFGNDRPAAGSATNEAANSNSVTNGEFINESDESRSSSATPTSGKKEKKSTGLKKMVRKLF